jgi:hypothetical protein
MNLGRNARPNPVTAASDPSVPAERSRHLFDALSFEHGSH